MNRTPSTPSALQNPRPAIDLQLIASRMTKLAEICVLDHLESLERSQAVNLSKMLRSVEEECSSAERCR